jgi:hypothetical protein
MGDDEQVKILTQKESELREQLENEKNSKVQEIQRIESEK